MAGDLSIHNVPTHLNLPGRTNREQGQQRRKHREQASQEDAGGSTGESAPDDNCTAPSESRHGCGDVGTQIDVEA
jgi:hypothetical protein